MAGRRKRVRPLGAVPKKGIWLDPGEYNPLLKRRIPRWRCDSRLVLAEFVDRKNPEAKSVIHPSLIHPGGWRRTWFHKGIPTGHTEERSCNLALREIPADLYRLKHVVSKDGKRGRR